MAVGILLAFHHEKFMSGRREMLFQLVYLYCAIGVGTAATCTLTSAKVIETTPDYLTEAECRRQLDAIPREAKVENDPRSGYASVICATREDIRREAQKSDPAPMRHMTPPPDSPTRAGTPLAG